MDTPRMWATYYPLQKKLDEYFGIASEYHHIFPDEVRLTYKSPTAITLFVLTCKRSRQGVWQVCNVSSGVPFELGPTLKFFHVDTTWSPDQNRSLT